MVEQPHPHRCEDENQYQTPKPTHAKPLSHAVSGANPRKRFASQKVLPPYRGGILLWLCSHLQEVCDIFFTIFLQGNAKVCCFWHHDK
jgi:hypothetical protein